MENSPPPPSDNIVELDLSAFSKPDIARIKSLGEKLKLLYRWFRSERVTQPGLDKYLIYSGDRTRTPYAAYRIERDRSGEYRLYDQKSGECLAAARSMDHVLNRLPDDFFSSK